MKICILSAVNVRHMSLISLYTKVLKDRGLEFDLIYMDKYDEDEDFDCRNKYRYINPVNQKWPKAYKAYRYMTFFRFATNILNREKYDFIIVWNDVAIFMFANYLARMYSGKYCLNVRDNMMYDKKIFERRYSRVFGNAAFRTVSSNAYTEFLPKNVEYIQIHSFNSTALEGMQPHQFLRAPGQPIRIGFIGYVRFFERNQRLLDIFSNDARFELHYYGTSANILKEYAEKNGIENSVFHDTFPVNETKKYLERIDIINNLYGNGDINLRKAISIKFYHALYSKIPILVCDKTYVGELAKQVGIGFEVIEINDEMKEKLYSWYRNLDFSLISQECDDYLELARKENEAFEEVMIAFVQASRVQEI